MQVVNCRHKMNACFGVISAKTMELQTEIDEFCTKNDGTTAATAWGFMKQKVGGGFREPQLAFQGVFLEIACDYIVGGGNGLRERPGHDQHHHADVRRHAGDFTLNVMNFVLKMMDFVLKMMNLAERHAAAGARRLRTGTRKMMDFVFKMMDFVLKLVDFRKAVGGAGTSLRDLPGGRSGAVSYELFN